MSNEVITKGSSFVANAIDLRSMFLEEMDGLTPSFEKIKIPSGGGIAYEVPGENSDSPDSVKEFKAVILHKHPINMMYKEKYNGGTNPPDCGSMDGKFGVKSDTGEVVECNKCPYSVFGSAEDERGKACKQKMRIYLLRENEVLPIILTLPTGSLTAFSKYIMNILQKGKKSNMVVTKFSLKKAQNAGGINYSQAVFSIDRDLTKEELETINKMSEQVRAIANKVGVEE